jgi:U3 small nucleolar RNA-associated protein 12
LAVSNHGNFVVTGSHDKSIRIWEKLEDPVEFFSSRFFFHLVCSYNDTFQLFLEEERERDLEKLYESGIADAMNREDAPIGSGSGDASAGNTSAAAMEVGAVSKQTAETLMAGERIMEALDIADADLASLTEYQDAKARLPPHEAEKLPPPPRNPLLAMQDLEPEAYVLKVVEQVHSTALQDALLVLPFGRVLSLMRYLDEWAKRVRDLMSHVCLIKFNVGVEHCSCFSYSFLLAEDASQSDRRKSSDAHNFNPSTDASA